jgi:hypothetical protein
LTAEGEVALFANQPPQTRFVLWFRRNRRCKWEAVFAAERESECVAAMCDGIGGRHHGHWLTLPVGKEP